MAPYHSYMAAVRGLRPAFTHAAMAEISHAAQLVHNTSYYRLGAGDRLGYREGGVSVPPERLQTLPVRAALDHMGTHLLSHVPGAHSPTYSDACSECTECEAVHQWQLGCAFGEVACQWCPCSTAMAVISLLSRQAIWMRCCLWWSAWGTPTMRAMAGVYMPM